MTRASSQNHELLLDVVATEAEEDLLSARYASAIDKCAQSLRTSPEPHDDDTEPSSTALQSRLLYVLCQAHFLAGRQGELEQELDTIFGGLQRMPPDALILWTLLLLTSGDAAGAHRRLTSYIQDAMLPCTARPFTTSTTAASTFPHAANDQPHPDASHEAAASAVARLMAVDVLRDGLSDLPGARSWLNGPVAGALLTEVQREELLAELGASFVGGGVASPAQTRSHFSDALGQGQQQQQQRGTSLATVTGYFSDEDDGSAVDHVRSRSGDTSGEISGRPHASTSDGLGTQYASTTTASSFVDSWAAAGRHVLHRARCWLGWGDHHAISDPAQHSGTSQHNGDRDDDKAAAHPRDSRDEHSGSAHNISSTSSTLHGRTSGVSYSEWQQLATATAVGVAGCVLLFAVAHELRQPLRRIAKRTLTSVQAMGRDLTSMGLSLTPNPLAAVAASGGAAATAAAAAGAYSRLQAPPSAQSPVAVARAVPGQAGGTSAAVGGTGSGSTNSDAQLEQQWQAWERAPVRGRGGMQQARGAAPQRE